MEALTILFAGLAAGSMHACSGPDHLLAVAPLSLSVWRRAWRVGFRWGLGHAIGFGCIALMVVQLRGLFDLEAVSWWSERAVGLTLVGVGLAGLVNARSMRADVGPAPVETDGARFAASGEHYHAHAALGIGMLHGLAGTSHLFGILPTLALPTQLTVGSYLCGYGAGNMLAMGGFAWLVGLTSSRVRVGHASWHRAALGAASIAAIAGGALWLGI